MMATIARQAMDRQSPAPTPLIGRAALLRVEWSVSEPKVIALRTSLDDQTIQAYAARVPPSSRLGERPRRRPYGWRLSQEVGCGDEIGPP